MNVEMVTGELKRLCGWGADWRRVATLPALIELSGTPMNASYYQTGTKVMDYLIASIRALEGPWEFHGHQIDSHKTQWALRVLLKIESRGDLAPARRFRAIRILELHGHTPELWRRDPSPERDLLRILGEAMCSAKAANLQAA